MTGPKPYSHTVEHCLEAAIGRQGLSANGFNNNLTRAQAACDRLRKKIENNQLPLLKQPFITDDLEGYRAFAEKFLDTATDLVILGTGGSSLGAQALAQITGWPATITTNRDKVRLWFFDNLDAGSFQIALNQLNPQTTRFMVISKSGATAETMIQFLCALSHIKARLGAGQLSRHFVGLSDPSPKQDPNPLRTVCAKFTIPVFDHHPDIGGRYSVFTATSLLPAAMIGLDGGQIRAGAASLVEELKNNTPAPDFAPAIGAAIQIGLMQEKKITSTILAAYTDKLEHFNRWFVQLWAESLGKQGYATTPLAALMPVDQHSQLQLWLGGPADKLFTILTANSDVPGPAVDAALVDHPALEYIAGKSITQLIAAQSAATIETLIKHGHPTRVIHLPKIGEYQMGALMMHFMLETIIAADMLNLDPYTQPAVEQGKKLVQTRLAALN